MALNAAGEAMLPVLMGAGGNHGAGAYKHAAADNHACHLLGEVVLGGAVEVVPSTVRLRIDISARCWAHADDRGR